VSRLVLFFVALGACQGNPVAKPVTATPAAVQTDVSAADYVAAPLPRATVTLTDAFGGPHVVKVEVAADGNSRTRGLMWRKQLAEGEGMLFIFPDENVRSFWMRNTLIPLDMVFINRSLKIVGIVERAEPQSLLSRGVPRPAVYVLEVPGGWTQKIGVGLNSTVEIKGTEAIRPTP
jgi:uncharacterized membrane protein (UPF0127 family)